MLKGYFHSKTIPQISQGRLYWFYVGERLARCCCPVGCRESPGNERAIQQEKSNTKERVVRYAVMNLIGFGTRQGLLRRWYFM